MFRRHPPRVSDVATDHPFTPVCSRAAFLATPACGEILRRLDEGLGEREPFLVVTGDPGTGKTTLAREVIARWGELVAVAFLAYSAVGEVELLEEIVRRFGIEPPEGGSRSRLVVAFERALAAVAARGQIALLVVDDAHGLGPHELESLRLLANAAHQSGHPLEILLLGLPALDARLDEAALAALRQRVAVRAKLAPLAPPDVRRYLQHRAGAGGADGIATFPKKTCREIAARTGGVPRRINVLAAESLRVARAWGDAAVGVEHVQTAAASLGGFIPVSLPDESDPGEDVPAVRVLPSKAEPAAAKPAAKVENATGAAASPPAAAATPHAPTSPPMAAATPPGASATVAAPEPARAGVPAGEKEPAKVPATSVAAKAAGSPPAQRAGATPAPRPGATAAPAPKPAASQPVAATPVPPGEEEDEPVVITPSTAKQDPQEWIARFVGDKGPLQIGSRSAPEEPFIDPLLLEQAAAAEDAEGAKEAPRPRGRTSSGPRSPRRLRPMPVPLPIVLAAIVVVVAVVLLVRAGVLARQSASRAPAASGRVKTSSVEPAASPAPPVIAAIPASAAATISEPAATTEEQPAKLPAARRYTIEVAKGLDYDTALAERDRVAALTNIHGWVIVPEDGGGDYRVVLGVFSVADRAQGAARMLVTSRTLPEATVIPMPPPRLRR